MHRIKLDNEVFEGENAVYLLGLDADGPTTLIDTGIDTPATESTLRRKLADLGADVADIDQVLLTHYHGDHAGLAPAIQAGSDATVRIHDADAEMVADPESDAAYTDRLRTRLEEWGMPDAAHDELMEIMARAGADDDSTIPVERFTDGDRLRVGDREFEVVYLPGHTEGQSGFYDPERDDLYAGDAVLPVYTPNVGGADVRVDSALAKYADSLRRVVADDADRILPGHREPIADPAGRAREILEHHRERTWRIVRYLEDEGPADAWTVSAHLFGDLQSIHILHGPGEAFAHLDHLAEAGAVERTDDGYELVEPELDIDAVLPTPE